jgi:putative membrane protein
MGRRIIYWMVGLGLIMHAGSCQDNSKSGTGDGVSVQKVQGTDELYKEDYVSGEHFLTEAIRVNQYEIELSQLALQKGETERVRDLAQKIIDEHEQFDQKIRALASHKEIDIPAQEQIDQATISRLEGLQGMNFDHGYLKELEESHRNTVELYENAADNVHDAEIQNFATRHLPTLKAHHALVDHGKDMIKDKRKSQYRKRE